MPGNAISSSAPEPFSLKMFVCSNIFSNVCSEPESSFKTAISFNLHQRKSTDEQRRWRSITWVFIWRGGGELVRSKKKGKDERRGGNAAVLHTFRFICVCNLCFATFSRCTAADGMWRPELPFLTLSNTHTHTRKHAGTHAYHAHTCKVYAYPPLKAHLLRLLPWAGTGAESVAAALLFTFSLPSDRGDSTAEDNYTHTDR